MVLISADLREISLQVRVLDEYRNGLRLFCYGEKVRVAHDGTQDAVPTIYVFCELCILGDDEKTGSAK